MNAIARYEMCQRESHRWGKQYLLPTHVAVIVEVGVGLLDAFVNIKSGWLRGRWLRGAAKAFISIDPQLRQKTYVEVNDVVIRDVTLRAG